MIFPNNYMLFFDNHDAMLSRFFYKFLMKIDQFEALNSFSSSKVKPCLNPIL